ncbi:hypothetical protein [Haliangium sp. UPWRP_2]|uniref:hypothetical protein n=1 Tax=Haliangium sp. UPWRP_2 TaxID=1931276 RepID=UPI0011B2899F|nr:hypothetical protein [Haliangium sp. UPWRP_2]
MYCPQVPQRNFWKRFLRSCLAEVWLIGFLSLFGCIHSSQAIEDNEIASHVNIRPIDLDSATAEKIGREALQKIGYEKIIRLAERAGFVAYKSDVKIQLASYEPVVAAGFVPVFSRYAAAAAVTSQADSPLPGPADIAAVGVVVVGLVDAGLLDGYLLNTLGGWLFSKAKTEVGAGAAKVEFPSADQLARKLGVSESQFHRQIKPGIVQDLAPEARRLGTKNPDIGVDSAGRVVLRNPKTGDTIITDVLLESYRP